MVENIEADKKSRKHEQRTAWMLNTKDFDNILNNLNDTAKVYLFATTLNCEIPRFVSMLVP